MFSASSAIGTVWVVTVNLFRGGISSVVRSNVDPAARLRASLVACGHALPEAMLPSFALRGEIDAGRSVLNHLVSRGAPDPAPASTRALQRIHLGPFSGDRAVNQHYSGSKEQRCSAKCVCGDVTYLSFFRTRLRNRYKDLVESPGFNANMANLLAHIWCRQDEAIPAAAACMRPNYYFLLEHQDRSRSSPIHGALPAAPLPPIGEHTTSTAAPVLPVAEEPNRDSRILAFLEQY